MANRPGARPTRSSKSRPEAPSTQRVGLWLLLLAAAVVLAYGNSLNGPFFLDDVVSIVDNPAIHDWASVRDLLIPSQETPLTSRPLVSATFALNYALGGSSVFGYHLGNIAAHLAAALALFGVVRRLLEQARLRQRVYLQGLQGSRAVPIAFSVALLWALHPLNTEAVDYVTQRTEVMMGFFYLMTLYASLRAVGEPAWPWTVTAILCSAAGMACKESMVTAPIAVVLVDRVFVFDSLRQAIRARWRLYAGLAATWIVLAALVAGAPGMRSAGFATGVGVWTYLLNQTVMIVRYLRLAVWPDALVVNYGWAVPLHLQDVWQESVAVVALLAGTVIALWRRPALGAAGAWFFLTLAPTSSILPIATEVGAERRMYLPLVALVGLIVIGATVVWDRFRESRGSERNGARSGRLVAVIAVTVVAAALGAGTIRRNREYRSAVTLAETTVARWPSSVGEHFLGTELALAGRKEEARPHLLRAIPGAPRAYYNLATIELDEGEWEAAIRDFRIFLEKQPLLLEAVDARLLLAQALGRVERWSEAIDECRQVLTMNPSRDQSLDARLMIADALRRRGDYTGALAQYQRYVQERPSDAKASAGLAISLVGLSRQVEAGTWFTRAADLAPDDFGAQRNAAIALLDARQPDTAARYAERAVGIQPQDAVAHDVYGQILVLQRQLPAAIAQFEIALRLDPQSAEVRAHLAQAQRLPSAP